jgi:hypothetical protein
MTKNLLTTFLIFSSLTIWGQKKIDNKLTNDHQNIKGTKISLIPPQGFADALNFQGLQQAESGSSIMVLDIPGPYSETSKGITKENMLSRGIEVKKIEKIIINQRPALFVTATQHANGSIYTKFILVCGSEKETIMLNGVFPESLKKIGAKVKKSMLTLFYDEGLKLDPFASVDYTMDISQTKLKFAKSMSGSLMYTVDGQIPTNSADKTNLITSKSFYPISQIDKKLFSINRIKQLPIDIESIEYTEEITIDGVSGYEIFAKAKSKKTGETDNAYQVILFSDQLYYIFFGTTNDETNASIEEIKKAILTFKRKG